MATALRNVITSRRKVKKMDDEEVVERVHKFVQANSIDNDASRSQHRIDALKRYRGDKQGDEVEGRSQIISRDVMEVIESLMPSLVKIFTATDKIVEFEPAFATSTAAFEQAKKEARQATALVNHVFFKENDGFVLLYAWMKAALLWRVGTVKVWWDNDPENDSEVYEGVDARELVGILTDGTLELLALEDDKGMKVEASELTPETMESMLTNGGGRFSCVVRTKQGLGRCVIEAVPPEEFVYDQYATNLNAAKVQCAHHRQMPLADVIAMGVPRETAEKLATKDERDGTSERSNRMDRMDASQTARHARSDADCEDEGMVWVTDAFLFIDHDGDGSAEYRRMVIAGPEHQDAYVIENKEIDDHWFAHCSPIIMPFEPEGESIDDQVSDIQRLKTVLWRQMLDNLYRTNSPRMGVLEGQVSLADVLSQQPGQPIRMRRPDAIFPIETPFTAAQSFPMIEHADVTREQRTGIVRYNQGIDADTLNKTAAGISIISEAGQARPELIARTFAETGFKRMAWMILRMTVRKQNAAKVIQVADHYVEVNPRSWRGKFSITAKVGVGTGNKDQLVMHMAQIVEQQKQVIMTAGPENPMVTIDHLYNGYTELLDAMGIKGGDKFFGNPNGWKPPPPEPTPEQVKAEAEAAERKAQAAKLAAEAQTIPAKLAEEVRSNQAKEEIERDKIVVDGAKTEGHAVLEDEKLKAAREMFEQKRRDEGRPPAAVLSNADGEAMAQFVAQSQQGMAGLMQTMQALAQSQQQMLQMLGQFMMAETELEYDEAGMPTKARRVFPNSNNTTQ